MKICPNCKREIDDDSVYCGYCSAKQPYVPEAEKDEAEPDDTEAAVKAAPVGWRCANCGEQLEANFDTCWKCGTVRARNAELQPGGEVDASVPILAVWGLDKRLEVYQEKVLVAPSGASGASGQAAYVAPCEIPIKDIVSIELTSAESGTGSMVVTYAAASPDDSADIVNMSESVSFNSGEDPEMSKALKMIKQCRAVLDARAQNGGR